LFIFRENSARWKPLQGGLGKKVLSENGNPSFATVLNVARALGVRLHAEAA